LGLRAAPDFPFCKVFSRFSNLFGQYTLSGKIRGKEIKIYTAKFPQCKYLPMRLIVKGDLKMDRPFSIEIKRQSLPMGLYKVFSNNIFFPKSPLLANGLLFTTDDQNLLEAILQYEEIQDRLCEICREKYKGVLMISNNSVTYYEPFRLIRKEICERIKNIADLICDVIDILKFSTRNVFPGEQRLS
jgi:hypothetical protein